MAKIYIQSTWKSLDHEIGQLVNYKRNELTDLYHHHVCIVETMSADENAMPYDLHCSRKKTDSIITDELHKLPCSWME